MEGKKGSIYLGSEGYLTPGLLRLQRGEGEGRGGGREESGGGAREDRGERGERRGGEEGSESEV